MEHLNQSKLTKTKGVYKLNLDNSVFICSVTWNQMTIPCYLDIYNGTSLNNTKFTYSTMVFQSTLENTITIMAVFKKPDNTKLSKTRNIMVLTCVFLGN